MEHYKNECIGRLPYDRFEVVMREKGTDADVKEEIEKTARQIGAQYIVVGSYGRKGDKEDPYRLGKTATHLVETAKVPSILVKKPYVRAKNETKGFNFLLAFDGSTCAKNLVKYAKDLARNVHDRVYAVHVVEDPTTNREEMEKEFRDLCLDMKCPLEEFSFVEKADPMEEIQHALVKWSNESEKTLYDFLLIGGTGMSAQKDDRYFVGKVVSYMMKKSVLNCIVVPGGQ